MKNPDNFADYCSKFKTPNPPQTTAQTEAISPSQPMDEPPHEDEEFKDETAPKDPSALNEPSANTDSQIERPQN